MTYTTLETMMLLSVEAVLEGRIHIAKEILDELETTTTEDTVWIHQMMSGIVDILNFNPGTPEYWDQVIDSMKASSHVCEAHCCVCYVQDLVPLYAKFFTGKPLEAIGEACKFLHHTKHDDLHTIMLRGISWCNHALEEATTEKDRRAGLKNALEDFKTVEQLLCALPDDKVFKLGCHRDLETEQPGATDSLAKRMKNLTFVQDFRGIGRDTNPLPFSGAVWTPVDVFKIELNINIGNTLLELHRPKEAQIVLTDSLQVARKKIVDDNETMFYLLYSVIKTLIVRRQPWNVRILSKEALRRALYLRDNTLLFGLVELLSFFQRPRTTLFLLKGALKTARRGKCNSEKILILLYSIYTTQVSLDRPFAECLPFLREALLRAAVVTDEILRQHVLVAVAGHVAELQQIEEKLIFFKQFFEWVNLEEDRERSHSVLMRFAEYYTALQEPDDLHPLSRWIESHCAEEDIQSIARHFLSICREKQKELS